MQLTAYRIVQEALTNVIRHAHASRVLLAVCCDGNHLTISVADDGRNAPRAGTAGLGLLGMRERAQAVGGTVTAAQARNGGFVVTAALPVGPR